MIETRWLSISDVKKEACGLSCATCWHVTTGESYGNGIYGTFEVGVMRALMAPVSLRADYREAVDQNRFLFALMQNPLQFFRIAPLQCQWHAKSTRSLDRSDICNSYFHMPRMRAPTSILIC